MAGACVFAAMLTLGPQTARATLFHQTNLVTDDQAALAAEGFGPAAFVDPHLINPSCGSGISTSGASKGACSAGSRPISRRVLSTSISHAQWAMVFAASSIAATVTSGCAIMLG
jgi:hypothetical protein